MSRIVVFPAPSGPEISVILLARAILDEAVFGDFSNRDRIVVVVFNATVLRLYHEGDASATQLH